MIIYYRINLIRSITTSKFLINFNARHRICKKYVQICILSLLSRRKPNWENKLRLIMEFFNDFYNLGPFVSFIILKHITIRSVVTDSWSSCKENKIIFKMELIKPTKYEPNITIHACEVNLTYMELSSQRGRFRAVARQRYSLYTLTLTVH